MKKIIAKTLLVFYFALVTLSCSKDEGLNHPGVALEVKKKEFVENYVNIVLASYEDTLNNLYDLESAIDAFVDNPTDASFKEAKNNWIISREPYGQTESFRYYDGPIDGSEGEPEGYINAWPLDEALIDYVTDGSGGQDLSDTRQNIINNTTVYPILTKDILRDISGYNSNESNVSIGYHVIEFLLWGQDNTEPSLKLNGQRPLTDYTTETNATRRGQYLKIVTTLLVEDVKSVVEQWKPGASYRSSFLALTSDIAITKILTGAAKLSKGELAGERMVVAVENQNQEDEQSCFSDNTHRDIYSNAQSIHNIINGAYKNTDGSSISGTSLLDVLKLVNANDANTLSLTATEVMNKVETISNAGHFDHQIMTETIDNFDNPVMSAVKTLRKQGDELAKAGKSITGNTIDPSV
ncbi:MAG: imelysin family protein [Polaribacter sp.]|nr:imelysin family protein [Polaribacter sp.]